MKENSDNYYVAIYWGFDGYGGTQRFAKKEDAQKEFERMQRCYEGRPKVRVHMWRERIDVIHGDPKST